MADTFTYTDSHSVAGVFSQDWYTSTVSPPPGRQPTAFTCTIAAALGAEFDCSLVVVGGGSSGSIVCTLILPAGTTTKSGTCSNLIPADATGYRFHLSSLQGSPFPYTVNSTITLTLADATPPPPCPYGTRAAANAPAVAVITDAAITAALTAFGAPWLAFMFAPLVGEAILSGSVCATLPPAVPNFATTDLLATVQQKAAWLNSVMWWTLCECAPQTVGGTPPPKPSPPVLTQPPDFPLYGPYSCTNSDICATLLQILKRLDELNQSQQVNFNQTTTVYASPRGIHYTLGPVHSNLTASGSLAVANLAGVRVDVTTPTGGPVLQGATQYLWDQGWMSVSDGGALLMERRIARASAEWLTPEFNLVTQFGWGLKPGCVIRVTELLPA